MVPSNNDWAPWKSGGELRAPCFLAPSLRDCYGDASGAQQPRRSHTERGENEVMKRKKKTGRLILKKGRVPPNYESAKEQFCARRESFKTAVFHLF